MSDKTPIYGIGYPSGEDLVSELPDHLKTLATGMERALDEVDRRATPAGSTPRTATSLAALNKLTGVVGQAGYVTGSGDDAGPYQWDGSKWVKTMLEDQGFNGVYELDKEVYTGRKWVDGRKIWMQVRKYENKANNSRTAPGIANMNTLLDYRVITSAAGGGLQPYLATDAYWHCEVTVTPGEIVVRKGSSNTGNISFWIVFVYTKK